MSGTLPSLSVLKPERSQSGQWPVVSTVKYLKTRYLLVRTLGSYAVGIALCSPLWHQKLTSKEAASPSWMALLGDYYFFSPAKTNILIWDFDSPGKDENVLLVRKLFFPFWREWCQVNGRHDRAVNGCCAAPRTEPSVDLYALHSQAYTFCLVHLTSLI